MDSGFDIAAAGAGDDQYASPAVGGSGVALGEGAGVAECQEQGEKGWGQAWLVERGRGQACVMVVIGGLGIRCWFSRES